MSPNIYPPTPTDHMAKQLLSQPQYHSTVELFPAFNMEQPICGNLTEMSWSSPCVIVLISQALVQDLIALFLVNSSSSFSLSNTASVEFAVHQWTLHRQGSQVLFGSAHIEAVQGNVGTEGIWKISCWYSLSKAAIWK